MDLRFMIADGNKVTDVTHSVEGSAGQGTGGATVVPLHSPDTSAFMQDLIGDPIPNLNEADTLEEISETFLRLLHGAGFTSIKAVGLERNDETILWTD